MEFVKRVIATSLAIKVFRRDLNEFAKFKMYEVYLGRLNAVIDKLYGDFNDLKREMYAVHHIDVKQLDGNKYIIKSRDKNEVMEFTSDELKRMTTEVMEEYLFGGIDYNN